MGTTNQAAGKKAKHNLTLTANTVETVTFVDPMDLVTIITDPNSTADVFVRVDGSDPTVNGDFAYRIPAGDLLTIEPDEIDKATPAVIVKMISSGTPTVSVQKGN